MTINETQFMSGDYRFSGSGLFRNDFLLTWEKSREDILAVIEIAGRLKWMREHNVSAKCFNSGLALSIFRDKSTRTRFAFASAANMLGLAVQDMDEEKSQVAHGETVRETANMVSFFTDIIGIRDDMFLGEGHTYMKEVGKALDDGYAKGVLHQRPGIINLQCDLDHPTQSMADLMHLIDYFGSSESLKGRKLAVSWAYSPSYGKPLSVAQGLITLMTRFGMDVTLAYPEGYNLIPEIEQKAAEFATESRSTFRITHSMDEAFDSADIVYPKSWAPFDVMEKRTQFLKAGDHAHLKELETYCLSRNAGFSDWECTEQKMKLTRKGEALYMHCLPADISGVSCRNGEVSEEVFEKYRILTYKEAGYKPYIIAAMMIANRFENPKELLRFLEQSDNERVTLKGVE